MSVELVDVSKLREHAERQSKLDRAIQSQEISKTAKLESQGPFTGLLKTSMVSNSQPQSKPSYVYTEYSSALHDVLAKIADHQVAGEGSVEDEIKRSRDVQHGVTSIAGGGIENDYLGLAGAVSAICLRHAAMKKMKPVEKNTKPTPKK